MPRSPTALRLAASAVAVLAMFVGSPAAGVAAPRKPKSVQVASSTFDADADGWTINGEAQGPNPKASGGHPGGYVSATDPPSTTGTSYWSAPSKFLGARNTSYKSKLTFDLRDSGPGRTFREADVVLISGSMVLEYRQKRIPKSKRWTRFTVKFVKSRAWTDASTGRKATSLQLLQALAALDALLIRGEFRNGAETFDLDNVVLYANAQ